jgi:thioredoxin-like negative regulator of GroEL
MAEKYTNKYIELSKAFNANKSQETIEALHNFMKELELEKNGDAEVVLTNVYILLKYHQKAYALYKKIYDENEAKAKVQLLKLQQMAQSYGDNFSIKTTGEGENCKVI